MTKEEVLLALKQKGLEDIVELIEDAETGDLEELELVESIGLVHDPLLNDAVLQLLQDLGVELIFVTDDEEEEEETD
ncbi:hypothetical protein [Ammoniphilus sp. CFH 90114]|uniref:hypothetical protein n=1 Tax=Ammoniphilus sp. CFH 90114 TaxID=2493665 RepID=UPI00100E4E7D|nr:hypothetical protein [Ammoniphilus sp. CFH 90114]RXT15222.1 hypothetical protein EIZ39_03150 [Ammoniphilus sp. CFH 90114]